jgi:radical SAM superfamily enzyme YgiQ (UPF0313 family)
MNALLIYPGLPVTFWSLKEALPLLAAQATIPPLGLLTVAAMLPDTWSKRLVDMNVRPLTDQDLAWADVAFIGAMAIQAQSVEEVIRRCRAAGVRICAGGVIYATPQDDLSPVDHLFRGEVEDTLPQFLVDLQAGRPRPVYQAEGFPELARTPCPQWDLINFSDYLTMPLQVTRGCPYDCDFCHVAIINGRRPRSKDVAQVMAEIDRLYQAGWRGPVMFVDDNFIGQKAVARRVLTALIDWQTAHSYPFIFVTQASVEVADHADLLVLLQRAGFLQLFLGLETPAAASLAECNKTQNLKRDLVEAVRILQKHSMDVLGGFIVGFDADPPSIFEEMAEFIEKAALPTAMVGVLAAPPGTRLYARLAAENRLTGQSDGDSIANLSGMNIIPVMGRARLLSGYKQLLTRLYEPGPYYQRVLEFLRHYRPNPFLPGRLPTWAEICIFLRVVWTLGIKDPDRMTFWGFLILALLRFPRLFHIAVATIIGGYHYKIMSRRFVAAAH